MTPRVAFGATPLEGGRHLRPGKAGSSVSLDKTFTHARFRKAAKELHHG
ncbi:hypothetical protein J2W49_002854 [Hydrogenophaga palleronii]|uniref:Uncharacterized protein n=1 Tax=Hydrogenophaga palleronii TaxID=65655 RepID=A0ABU1WNM7_9BURK|nr:hypothetical protein [Hydrogenophaga palleronii]